MKQRTFKINVQYTSSYGFATAIGSHADTLRQAMGLCRWYTVEIKRTGGTLVKAEAIICDSNGLELKSIAV